MALQPLAVPMQLTLTHQVGFGVLPRRSNVACRAGPGPAWPGLAWSQVRYDRSVGAETALRFMTDGILLRQLQLQLLLPGYSCVVVDEAHERALNTDLLLGA